MSNQKATVPFVEVNELVQETRKQAKPTKAAKVVRNKKAAAPVAAFVPLPGTESMSQSWQQLYKEISKEIGS